MGVANALLYDHIISEHLLQNLDGQVDNEKKTITSKVFYVSHLEENK